ncbi:MAG TPA: acetate--CoA ligase family protein [Stellaceae bacterium]|jgi:acyl-CoA synthetase (NDP forming)|nr:acetate--CoA ligase family protein [Stellaceae bacterium]
MTAHPLSALLAPNSVAIFGASNDPTRISGRSLRYYREAGYKGGLYPINPTRDTVQGLPAFPDLKSVPGPVECAVIAVPANLAIESMEACVAKGVRGVVMFTAGFAEIGPEGRAMQERITQIAHDNNIRLCGPNCLGLFNMHTGHTPTFSSFLEEGPTRAGPLGMITQSGAFGTHLLALTARRGIQVGVWMSTGNEADVAVADGISFLADDPDTKAIACYVEAIKDGALFAEAVARARANGKPVIAMKVGGSTIGAAAAASHTASLAGSDAVYDAALRQLGVERAKTPEDLVEIAYACTRGRLPRSRRLAVMTMSGGAGVLMADAAEEEGLDLAPLSEDSQKQVIEWVPFAAARNPVDVTAQALNDPSILDKSFELLFGKEKFPAMVGFFTTWASSPQMAEPLFKAVSGAAATYPDRFFALSAIASPEMQRRYEDAGIGVFEDPWRAVQAIAAATRCAERLDTPPLPLPPVPQNPAPLPAGPLGEHDAKRILAAAGVPILDERVATSAAEAEAAAKAIGERLVLKIVSPEITHKTEVGGVMLDVPAAEAGAAYTQIVERVKARAPQAHIEGVLLSPMIKGGVEMILGVQDDPVFGPVVLLGLGGIFVEILKDVTFRIAPFGVEEAHRMIRELRGVAMLEGARGQPPCDLDALAEALSRLSIFAAAQRGRFTSIDVNPLLVRPKGQGAAALDALILTPGATATGH